jgi:hypothetical protein
MSNDKYEKYPEFQFAKYYLAVPLYDMGVRYGSLMYFVDILEKDPLLPHTHECLRRAVEIAQELKDDELDFVHRFQNHHRQSSFVSCVKSSATTSQKTFT